MVSATPNSPWWHASQLNNDECRHFRLGPLNIYLQRQQQQWLLAHEYCNDDNSERPFNQAIPMIPAHLTCQRFLFKQSPAQCQFSPRLLDRPVVVKTLQPVNLPAGEQSTFFISSPVCVQLTLQTELTLADYTVQRLSDTWFGPSTQVGELCYADKTHARHARADLPLRWHRAVTPVTIHNQAQQMLTIDKISIPVPFLALYAMADGNLWTDPVTLRHEGVQSLAHFHTGKLAPADAAQAQLLAAPREKPERHSLFRAFTDIFSD